MIERVLNDITFLAGHWPLSPDKPTLIFIHGAGNRGAFWKAQVEGLADACNTIALDLPGHGGSGGSGCPSIGQYAAAVASFLDALQPPLPVPCGLSMGGAITLQLLIDRRDHFEAGILVNSGARLRVLPAIFEMIEKDYAGYVRSLPLVAASPKTNRALLDGLLADNAACRPAVVAGDFRACDGFDCMARLGEITVPVLVLSAEDDRLSPPKYAAYLAASIEGARRVHIMDAGHLSPVERPDAVNDAIRTFLASLV